MWLLVLTRLVSMIGYMNMSPPQFERVVEDCDSALQHDPNYVKALNRRANALEALSRYEESLRGEYDGASTWTFCPLRRDHIFVHVRSAAHVVS